jgi:hypothetical protein
MDQGQRGHSPCPRCSINLRRPVDGLWHGLAMNCGGDPSSAANSSCRTNNRRESLLEFRGITLLPAVTRNWSEPTSACFASGSRRHAGAAIRLGRLSSASATPSTSSWTHPSSPTHWFVTPAWIPISTKKRRRAERTRSQSMQELPGAHRASGARPRCRDVGAGRRTFRLAAWPRLLPWTSTPREYTEGLPIPGGSARTPSGMRLGQGTQPGAPGSRTQRRD